MPQDWSAAEVEAAVADYFAMLDLELRGQGYNKSDHRRRLSTLLDHRSEGAIERKHQNISAILIELGFVYLSGYKPLRNYQQRLFDAVEGRLARSANIAALLRAHVARPALVPTVDDILTALEEPPAQDPDRGRYQRVVARERPSARTNVDYLAMEASNRSLGTAGEEFVVRFEVARLTQVGEDRLAAKVERVSETRGDSLGFDVLSFDVSGRERLIEVKTTAYGSSTPFFVTRNEVDVSRDRGDLFHLYRAFNFRKQPRLFYKQGPIDQAFGLEPSQFLARVT